MLFSLFCGTACQTFDIARERYILRNIYWMHHKSENTQLVTFFFTMLSLLIYITHVVQELLAILLFSHSFLKKNEGTPSITRMNI